MVANHLRFRRATADDLAGYNVLQRLSYTTVVFVLLPLMIWTGLAMSPAVTSVVPVPGDRRSAGSRARGRSTSSWHARSSLFLLVHVALVWQTGFRSRMRAMITAAGRRGRRERMRHERAVSRRTLIKTGLGAARWRRALARRRAPRGSLRA